MLIKKLLVLLSAAFLSVSAMAQDREVSGVVTGDDGAPLPGVSVTVKDSSTGTVTDVDGKYIVRLPEGGGGGGGGNPSILRCR